MTRRSTATLLSTLLASLLFTAGCTGGSESSAATDEPAPKTATSVEAKAQAATDARQQLSSISKAIPIYEGAEFRDDLTRRDEVMIRNQYGANAQVYTLASDDSYPQVYHYYTTYLAQFRGFPAQDTYPNSNQQWRTLEVPLNSAMQDPFIPGDTIDPNGKQVILQVAETEAEPKTVIRYIVTPSPAPAAPVATTASAGGPAQPVAR